MNKSTATSAQVIATSMCFGGFRATIFSGSKQIASQHFAAKGWGNHHVNAAHKAMKTWMAAFGVS